VALERTLNDHMDANMEDHDEVTIYAGGARLDDEAQLSKLLLAVKAGADIRRILAEREARIAMCFDPEAKVGCYVVTDGRSAYAFSAQSITQPQAAEVWERFERDVPSSAAEFAKLVATAVDGEIRTVH
jgi:hypothetical protein